MKTALALFLIAILTPLLYAETNQTEASVTQEHLASHEKKSDLTRTASENVKSLLLAKEALQSEILENNVWIKIYSNYHTYKELEKKKNELELRIKTLQLKSKKKKLSGKEQKKIGALREKLYTLEGKLQLLKEYENDPFKKLLTPPEIGEIPVVTNPFAIIGALSFIEKLNNDQEEYYARFLSLKETIEKLEEESKIITRLLEQEPQSETYKKELALVEDQLKTLMPVMEIFQTTHNVYTKKIDEIILDLTSDIKKEIEKALTILAVLIAFLIVLLIIKYFVRKYMSDNERFYTINKALNVSFILLSLITLLFAYIENVSYLVTILGFASAGIAIAMKDLFMSLLGWFAIVLGGAVHVGDRVRFVRDGVEYVGDIVDISLLRMTMHEDVTLTTFALNRRAGRIVFIPNNVVFTDMIANYSHSGLKTVWDGIDFVVTFDSDAHRAASIAKEVARKYSKGYTDITRKQLNKLRSHYSIRNTNVEPRIFTFIESYGIKVSVWYLTNAYATLTLRSTISAEIVRRVREEECVTFAYPIQTIFHQKGVPEAGCAITETPPENLESLK